MPNSNRDIFWMLASALLTLGLLTLPSARAATETGSAKAVKEKASETVDASKAYIQKQKTEYESEVKASLAKLDLQIAKVKEDVKAHNSEARAEVDAQIKRIELERKTLVSRLEALQSSGNQAWTDVKKGVDSAWTELKNSVQTATSRFSKSKKD